MRVLWVSNTIFPDLSKALGNDVPVLGGWMYGLAKDLIDCGAYLIVATVKPNVKQHQEFINGIDYYLLNSKKPATHYDVSLEAQWIQIVKESKPDIVHIHGTEYAHGLSLMRACPDLNYVISIQGLISVYARYYTGHIPYWKIKKFRTLKDILKKDGILKAQEKFYQRGEQIEKQYFKLGKHFIGRTQWDYDHTQTLSNKSTYHFCNESLRDSFYTSPKWNIASKSEHTIFLSQAGYPIKGLHQVLEATALLKDIFPKIHLRIAGDNITKNKTLKDKIALGGYGNYILYLSRKYNLEEHISFTGFLDEQKMVQEYLNCHLFVCPSSIENSPNSLGEAQLLGTPCIASYVGGIPDMINHGSSGLLYRYEEVEMLAQVIKKVFQDDNLANTLSQNGTKVAGSRHKRNVNAKRTLAIYDHICGDETK